METFLSVAGAIVIMAGHTLQPEALLARCGQPSLATNPQSHGACPWKRASMSHYAKAA
jgi:hypothetical protein